MQMCLGFHAGTMNRRWLISHWAIDIVAIKKSNSFSRRFLVGSIVNLTNPVYFLLVQWVTELKVP